MIPGTLVHEAASAMDRREGTVRLGHPAGVSDEEISIEQRDGEMVFPRIAVCRTARRLLEGYAFVRRDLVEVLA